MASNTTANNVSDKLRFDQRHGAVTVPSQLRPHDVSDELKAKLWAGLHSSLENAIAYLDYSDARVKEPWRGLLYRWHVNFEHQPSDEFNNTHKYAVKKVRSLIYVDDWARLYTFLEFVVASSSFRNEARYIGAALQSARAAWRLVDNEIVPISSTEAGEAIVTALSEVTEIGPDGAKAHLRQASVLIANGDWAGSVRESIHAVESVAGTFEKAASLGDALKAIQKSGRPLHPALAKGFAALYGYTSDESGVRHALLENGAAAVGENEALFMYGTCATFCQYLLNVRQDISEG